MSKIANESSNAIESFRVTLSTFNEDALSTSLQATVIENTTFVTLAKIDHIMFKSNAYKTLVNGKSEVTFSDHHNCRLGKWYENGSGKERFAHLSSYKEIEKPHETVHNVVHKNIKFIENGDHTVEHKDEVVQNFKIMEDASQTLFTLMDSLIRESEEEILNKRS
jgi:hypothetical protein